MTTEMRRIPPHRLALCPCLFLAALAAIGCGGRSTPSVVEWAATASDDAAGDDVTGEDPVPVDEVFVPGSWLPSEEPSIGRQDEPDPDASGEDGAVPDEDPAADALPSELVVSSGLDPNRPSPPPPVGHRSPESTP